LKHARIVTRTLSPLYCEYARDKCTNLPWLRMCTEMPLVFTLGEHAELPEFPPMAHRMVYEVTLVTS